MKITTSEEYDAASVIVGLLHDQRTNCDLCEEENVMLGVLEEAMERFEDCQFPIDLPEDA
ncbi:MAG: hypothetical protein ACYDHA_14160 [Bellilinea sp.]